MRTKFVGRGPGVGRFETALADWLGAPAVLATSSCTAAMEIALAIFDLKPGDAVFVPAITFPSTINVIRHRGATPVIVDVEPDTLNMDVGSLGDQIIGAIRHRLRPRVVMPVHYAGLACDLTAIAEVARTHGLAIVEDAAHALPAEHAGRRIGAERLEGLENAHLTAFSFSPLKPMTTGEGGALIGSVAAIERARPWMQHGIEAWNSEEGRPWDYDVTVPGFKASMTDIGAAIGGVQLTKAWDHWKRRCDIARFYSEHLVDLPVDLPPDGGESVGHAWHLYVVKLHDHELNVDRDEVIRRLKAEGVGSNTHFRPLHQLAAYSDPGLCLWQEMAVSDRAWPRLLSLPIHPCMEIDDPRFVASTLRRVLDGARR